MLFRQGGTYIDTQRQAWGKFCSNLQDTMDLFIILLLFLVQILKYLLFLWRRIISERVWYFTFQCETLICPRNLLFQSNTNSHEGKEKSHRQKLKPDWDGQMEDNVLRPEYSGDTRHTQTDLSVQPGKYFSLSLLFYVYECLSIYLYVHLVPAEV